MAFSFHRDYVVVGIPDWNELKADRNTGQYFHMTSNFIRPRVQPHELNDQVVETLDAINQEVRNVYIGEDTDEDVVSEKNKNQVDQK